MYNVTFLTQLYEDDLNKPVWKVAEEMENISENVESSITSELARFENLINCGWDFYLSRTASNLARIYTLNGKNNAAKFLIALDKQMDAKVCTDFTFFLICLKIVL